MLLRAVETMLANLLKERFSAPNDPHAILDSLSEHVHMALDAADNKGAKH